ncbi:MAG: hypothetical protein P1S60_14595, partial [Anaerolineae bacterium]|nr:hypothetical protein [Anaerolineae bacterium]
WLWGFYASVEGPTENLPVWEAPPTPTPLPTNTPTPTPTLPPDLVLPASPQLLGSFAPLVADLYYIRHGRLNIWLAEGSHSEIPLLAEDNFAEVHSYRITGDGRYAVYVTTTGQLYALDRATWEQTFIPTSGYLIHNHTAHFEINRDGSHIIYIAWGVQPSSASAPQNNANSGTILAIDTHTPHQTQTVIGYCQGNSDIPCSGFRISPDETRLAYSDSLGVWMVPIHGGEAQRIAAHPGSDPYTELLWSGNGNWLLLRNQSLEIYLYENVEADPASTVFNLCVQPCSIESQWAAEKLWFIINYGEQGCLQFVDPNQALEGQVGVTQPICEVNGFPLQPSGLSHISNQQISILNQGCDGECNGLYSGVYTHREDFSLYPIALGISKGSVIWTGDGAVFLLIDKVGAAKAVGWISGNSYWDVSTLLKDGHAFQWGQPLGLAP